MKHNDKTRCLQTHLCIGCSSGRYLLNVTGSVSSSSHKLKSSASAFHILVIKCILSGDIISRQSKKAKLFWCFKVILQYFVMKKVLSVRVGIATSTSNILFKLILIKKLNKLSFILSFICNMILFRVFIYITKSFFVIYNVCLRRVDCILVHIGNRFWRPLLRLIWPKPGSLA